MTRKKETGDWGVWGIKWGFGLVCWLLVGHAGLRKTGKLPQGLSFIRHKALGTAYQQPVSASVSLC